MQLLGTERKWTSEKIASHYKGAQTHFGTPGLYNTQV